MNDERVQEIKSRVLPLRSAPFSELSNLEKALIFDAAYLLTERAKLVAVAEAARVLDYHGRSNECVMVNKDKWNALRQALAALDALEQGE